ncbi:hypothetical protein C0991_010429 [Blastosporella zonata]|nr:hypothetical protein C0991_010429 [Blastosporella zonata]
MRITDSDQHSLSASPDFTAHAGPSPDHANGHSNGFTTKPATNGSTNGLHHPKNGKAIAKVTLPGTNLYDDTPVNREEYVRLVIQSLRDVGYIESAATLEAESGFVMEAPEVADFRQCILDGSWTKAETALMRLGVTDEDALWDARFLINQQKYLELLEAKKTTQALHVLRNDLAPLDVDSDQLHTLSRHAVCFPLHVFALTLYSLMMCSEPDDLRQRAGWDGAAGYSRRQLLHSLQQYIPSSIMIPQRRISTLLNQAQAHQRQHCLYHNSPSDSSSFSLYTDHHCNKSAFPRITTTILEVHSNEVWNMEWSHDGLLLATASKDESAIIWRLSDADGNMRDKWGETGIRITDLAITPDFSRLVSVGMQHLPVAVVNEGITGREVQNGDAAAAGAAAAKASENKMIIYDLTTKLVESSIRLDGELTSVKISQDSRYALINHAPDEIHLWDLEAGRLARKYTGQRQGRYVIRSCFGGYDGNFVVSGSEDGNVYIWHRDTGVLLETLSGHGEGSVNSVAWNPINYRMFASCSDDHTIRIWEAPLELMIDEPLEPMSFVENRNGNGNSNGKGKTRQRWDADGVEI